MAFIQIIDVTTTRLPEIEVLMDDWIATTEGKRTTRRSVLTEDRDRPNTYVQMVEFPSYEDAMTNSNLPETPRFPSSSPSSAKRRPPSATSTSGASTNSTDPGSQRQSRWACPSDRDTVVCSGGVGHLCRGVECDRCDARHGHLDRRDDGACSRAGVEHYLSGTELKGGDRLLGGGKMTGLHTVSRVDAEVIGRGDVGAIASSHARRISTLWMALPP